MTIRYHVTVPDTATNGGPPGRPSELTVPLWAARPREEALTHIENAILKILTEMESSGVLPPPDTVLPDSIVLTFAAEAEA